MKTLIKKLTILSLLLGCLAFSLRVEKVEAFNDCDKFAKACSAFGLNWYQSCVLLPGGNMSEPECFEKGKELANECMAAHGCPPLFN